MARTFTIIALAAVAATAGCDNSDHTITSQEPYDPQAEAIQNLQNIELPPAIVASHAYRCADNSLLYIDWLSNDTARINEDPDEVGTTATREDAEGPYAAEGQSLSGSPDAETITVNGQTCRR